MRLRAYSAMTEDARKRIQALEQFSELGSGFNIAMKDLEIRGAGDLLGGEQSGFINEIGFETYQKIMNEAIEELKENEFKDLYEEEGDEQEKEYVKDIQIDTDFELLFPDEYINNITERLNLYNELATIKDEEGLVAFEQKLIDRFGALPKPAQALLTSMRIKWLATKMGLEKLVLKQSKMVGYFVGDQQSDYYQSPTFRHVLKFVQQFPSLSKMKEKQTKNGLRLLLTFENVKTLKRAHELLQMVFE
ncbi:transcription-repair coupling factor, partial [Nostoc linckia z15]